MKDDLVGCGLARGYSGTRNVLIYDPSFSSLNHHDGSSTITSGKQAF
jgi:hypothetical protein